MVTIMVKSKMTAKIWNVYQKNKILPICLTHISNHVQNSCDYANEMFIENLHRDMPPIKRI